MGCCLEGPAGLEVREVLWKASLKDFLDSVGVSLGVADLGCEGEEEALACIALNSRTSRRSIHPAGTLILFVFCPSPV